MKKNNDKIICLGGKNEIGVFGLQLLLKKVNKENIRVVHNSDDPGYDTWQPSLIKFARQNNIDIISIEDFYNYDDIIFISLEFYKIIVPSRFSNSALYNIHFSNLPSYKGMYTSALPILNNEKEAGVTFHKIDAGIDTGEIIDQIIFPISNKDTARNLYFKYLSYSKKLFKKNLDKILTGKVKSRPQRSLGSTYYSKKAIDYKNLNINLLATADQIKNQIRAFLFPEYQVPRVYGYYVNDSVVKTTSSTNKPGKLLSVSDKELEISTIDYDLILHRDKNAELHCAASTNDLNLATQCIKSGANINMRMGGNGLTPTLIASYNGALDVLRLLINNGADVNISSYDGTTSLMYAMYNYESHNDKMVFELLKNNGANRELCDVNNKNLSDYLKERNINELF